ncbi:MAG: hypothetical protein AAGG59_06890 [Bacteroidota bacterium]
MGLKNLTSTYKSLFLIDATGAAVTALMLSQVLARLGDLFGMPVNILYILAIIATCFALYSLICSCMVNQNWRSYLQGIAIANAVYCILTLALVIYLYDTLTWLGIGYFIGEIGIICLLVRFELKLMRQ